MSASEDAMEEQEREQEQEQEQEDSSLSDRKFCSDDSGIACPDVQGADDTKDIGVGTGTIKSPQLLYGLNDVPPAVVLVLLSLQHCLVQLLPCLLAVHAIAPALCLPSDDPARADLLCRLLLVAAVATLLNNTSFGFGLGLVQGPCMSSLGAVLLSVASLDAELPGEGEAGAGACPSGADQFAMGPLKLEAVWRPRAQRLQATLLITAVSSTCLAAAGLPRLIAKFQSPLTAAVATILSVLPLIGYTINAASANWIGALSGALAVLASALVLRQICLPVLVCSVRRGHMHARLLPAMSVLAVLLPLLVGWTACAILTAVGLLHSDNPLSTSEWRADRIHAGAMFSIPWPAPWGWPALHGLPWATVAAGVSAGLAVGATAHLTTFSAMGAATGSVPDGRRLQRGLLMSSSVGFLGALWGAPCSLGGGQETPGVVALTQTCAVAAARLAGVVLLLVSLSPSLASAVTAIPLPLQAGAGLTLLAAGSGQGIRYLREVDLKSARNCVIFGLSILAGVSVACRLGLPPLAPDSGPAVLESVDAMAAAVVASSPLAGSALSMVLDTVFPTRSPRLPHPV